MHCLWIPLLTLMLSDVSFKDAQLQNDRVKAAYEEKELTVKGYFSEKGHAYEGFHLFIRAFKKERLLEVWIKPGNSDSYSLLHTYSFCATSGTLGPKRKEGDLQIPEGFYQINHFNPQSNFHLSLGLNYPNQSDRILGDKTTPGSAIYIHGNCVTIGCIPITDDKIKELYVLAVEARNNGQAAIPVHCFPAKLDQANLNAIVSGHGTTHLAFWNNLKIVFEDFEKTRKLKRISVTPSGEYRIH